MISQYDGLCKCIMHTVTIYLMQYKLSFAITVLLLVDSNCTIFTYTV